MGQTPRVIEAVERIDPILRHAAVAADTSVINVLEVCGIASFNLSPHALHALYVHFAQRYRVAIVPGGGYGVRLPAPEAREILRSKNVKRTARWTAQFTDHVGIDHRRFHVGVPEIFLNLPDVDTIEQQMRGERVTK